MSASSLEPQIDQLPDSELKSDGIPTNKSPLVRLGNPAGEKMVVVLIGDEVLFRDCLANCLNAKSCLALTFPSLSAWQKAIPHHPAPSVVAVCSRAYGAAEIEQELLPLDGANIGAPIVLLSEGEDVEHVFVALHRGVRGYIPTSVTLDVAVEALRLVAVGGVYIPAGCLYPPGSPPSELNLSKNASSAFTTRELEVLAALQQGKQNKRLAYDLEMSESTVKVHVRNIMKKLKARNRTEVAFLTRKLFPFSQDSTSRSAAVPITSARRALLRSRPDGAV